MPSRDASSRVRGEEGTASVEVVAAVPFLLLALLAAAQVVLAGQALWSAGVAARAGARAALVGGNAVAAARKALPPPLRSGARVEGGGEVSVRVRVPALLPSLPEVTLGASAALERGGG